MNLQSTHLDEFTHFTRMNDQCDMTILFGCERPQRRDNFILHPESIIMTILATHTHHKLQVIDDDMIYIIHVLRMLNCLRRKY